MNRRLKQLRHLALDLDGTLYLGSRLFEATRPFLDMLRRRGIGYTFFTNNSSRSTKQYVQKLNNLGIEATTEDIYSSTSATLDYLRQHHPTVKRSYLLGTPGLAQEFSEHGFEVITDNHDRDRTEPPQAVIVGFDTTLTYPRLCRASYWIAQGLPFIATHCDLVCPTDEATVLPDCGAICALLAAATGRQPDAVLGKPHASMLRGVMQRHGVQPAQLGVVGDRLYTDMAMARGAGAMGILVLSGEATREQAHGANPGPDLIVTDIGELTTLLEDVLANQGVATC